MFLTIVFIVFPFVFGLVVGVFLFGLFARRLQFMHVGVWRLIATTLGVSILGSAISQVGAVLAAAGTAGGDQTDHLLIFVSCLGGTGVGGLYVMYPFIRRLYDGWDFYMLFVGLREKLNDAEVKVLVNLSSHEHWSLMRAVCRLRMRITVGRWPTRHEAVMCSLGLPLDEYNSILGSAARKVHEFLEAELFQWNGGNTTIT